MKRLLSEAIIHDNVIAEVKNVLNQKEFDIYTNPGQEKNAGIGENYPDVIMTEKGTNKVKFILEIETNNTVTFEEANSQWKKYSDEINATFYLVVPQHLLNKATTLCQQIGINVRFATYVVNNSNIVSFKFN